MADFIVTSGNRLSEEANGGGDQSSKICLDVNEALETTFDPDSETNTPNMDDENALVDELLSHAQVLTETELKCLLRNRPEFWDTEMKMHEKTRKRVDILVKLYDLQSAE